MKKIERLTLLFTFQLFSSLICLCSELNYWPRFRGPNGTGLASAPSLPTLWEKEDVLWIHSLPGKGHSSPVIWDDHLYISWSTKHNGVIALRCLSTESGEIFWEKRFRIELFHVNRDNSFATSTPCLNDKAVYFYWASPQAVMVAAFSHEGKELWRRDLGPYRSLHGPGVSPIFYNGLIIIPNDQKERGSLIALDAQTGKTKWKIERTSTRAAYATPCVYESSDDSAQVIFLSTAHGVTSVDLNSGKILWEVKDVFPLRVVSSPVVAGQLIIGTCGQGGSGRRLVAVKCPRKGEKPRVVYKLERNVPYVPTPLYYKGLLFLLADNGVASCLDAQTGKLLKQIRLRSRFYSSFICVDGRLYAVSRKGEVYVLRASESFELLGMISMEEGSHATCAVSKNRMYLRTFSKLICIGQRQKEPGLSPARETR